MWLNTASCTVHTLVSLINTNTAWMPKYLSKWQFGVTIIITLCHNRLRTPLAPPSSSVWLRRRLTRLTRSWHSLVRVCSTRRANFDHQRRGALLLTSPDLAVGADGRHGQGGDGGDDGWQQDDDDGHHDARLPDHPRQPQEDHHAEDVQQTANLSEQVHKEQIYTCRVHVHIDSERDSTIKPNLLMKIEVYICTFESPDSQLSW